MAATVWVKPLGEGWQPVGSYRERPVWHEGLVCVSDQWGPKTCTFTLRRQRRAVFPDLLTRTPIIVEEGGVRVWAGRIKEVPEQSGAARQLTVQAVGAQARLDGDQLERILVHTKLADYKDSRSQLASNLASLTQAWTVTNDQGAIVIALPNGSAAVSGTAGGAVTLDFGPASTAKRVVVEWEALNGTNNLQFIARTSASADAATSGQDVISFGLGSGASGTTSGTSTTARRYVHLLVAPNTSYTAGADNGVKVKSVQVFADTAYESGNASVLSAKTIIVDALTRATSGLHPDQSGIGDPTFAFPSFAPDRPMTARELVAAANAAIPTWQFKINEELKPVYRARPTVPAIELGAWLGAEGDTDASNSDEGIITKVIVRGTGPDGTPVRVTRTQTGTLVDRQGDVECRTLDTAYTLTTTFANQLGDAYLAAHRVAPFKGQNVITAQGARRPAGGTIRPAHLLLLTGDLARRTDLIDPDTGALGRTGVIDQVTWRADEDRSELDLDNTRRDYEALQERLGLLIPA